MKSWLMVVGMALLLIGFGLGSLYQGAVTEELVTARMGFAMSPNGEDCACMMAWACRADHACYAEDMWHASDIQIAPIAGRAQ